MTGSDWLSFKQLVGEYRAIPEPTWRRRVFDSKTNGLDKAILRHGRRLIFHRPTLEEWLREYGSKSQKPQSSERR